MSFTNCPSCGKEISDKATKCPACDLDLTTINISAESSKIFCEECKEELPLGAEYCPNCGCPVTNKTKKMNYFTTINEKFKHSNTVTKSIKILKDKKKASIFFTAVFLIIISLIISTSIKSNSAKKNYQSTFNVAVSKMLDGGAKAENTGNLIKSVWYNTIYKKSDIKTNKYTKKNGSFNKDFNDSLSALFSDSSFSISINTIKSNQIAVESLMKSLKNPPKDYEEAYAALKELYNSYNELTGLVTNPTGSLSTFSSNFNTADTNMSTYYKAVKVYTNN